MDLFLINTQFVDYLHYMWIIVLLLSAVWTLILTAPIHCKGSVGEKAINAKILHICSILDLEWAECE